MDPSPRDGPIAYLNGKVMAACEAKLAVFDAGIVMGATVADMGRTFGHRLFRLADHVERLYASAKYAGIEVLIPAEETLELAETITAHNAALLDEKSDLALVMFLTPGELSAYAGHATSGLPTYCIHTFPLAFERWQDYYVRGAHLVVPSVRQIPAQCWSPKMKCRSRMHWWLASREVQAVDPGALPLCLDLAGNITETALANFLLVKRGTVVSPDSRGILWGVSLAVVQELCRDLGIAFVQDDVQLHDAINADEAMITSTPFCLAPVTRINGAAVGSGAPGPVFQRLIEHWSGSVGVDIVGQILGS